MNDRESMILQEFLQSRIEHYHRAYMNAVGDTKRNALLEDYNDCRKIFEKLPEEDRAVISAYEETMFKTSADKEVRTFAAGFQDGLRFGKLLHELESTPLDVPRFWTDART